MANSGEPEGLQVRWLGRNVGKRAGDNAPDKELPRSWCDCRIFGRISLAVWNRLKGLGGESQNVED